MTLEELQEQMITMQEQMKTLQEDKTTLETKLQEQIKREQELKELNQKLFLRVTTETKEEQEVKEEIPSCIDETIFQVLSNKEKQELKELISGEE